MTLPQQPPWDSEYELNPGRPYYILHYTYGLDFNETSGEHESVGEYDMQVGLMYGLLTKLCPSH